jgi:hypothetical protein
MTADRWRRVEAIYEAALERTPRERAAFLETRVELAACSRRHLQSGDASLLAQGRGAVRAMGAAEHPARALNVGTAMKRAAEEKAWLG